MTGHSYIVYGPLCNGATSIMYEGAPDWPDKDRLWAIAEKYKATILYTAPTAIRAFMKWGTEFPEKHDLSSLRLLGTVGEPINPEAWIWYQQVHRRRTLPDRRHVVADRDGDDHGHSPARHHEAQARARRRSRSRASAPTSWTTRANSVPLGGAGYVVLTRPWPAMLRTIWGDDERYKETYWSQFPGKYFPGDGCKRDEEGYFWFLGRVDDVMNVAGHRISTYEVESALVDHPSVAEVGRRRTRRRGQGREHRRVRDAEVERRPATNRCSPSCASTSARRSARSRVRR